MRNYQKIENINLSFSNCQICDAKCCDGRRGSVYSELLLSEFESVSEHFPILFLRDFQEHIQAIILLSNGEGYCRYLKDFKCSIYESRPATCKTYPFRSDMNNNISVDISCPALCASDTSLVNNGKISSEFDNKILHNYKESFEKTANQFKEYNKLENLEIAFSIMGINFYKFKSDMDNEFLKIHLKSLKNLEKLILKREK